MYLKDVEWIRMGTTVATNALLERKGEPTALLITEGFKVCALRSDPSLFLQKPQKSICLLVLDCIF